MKRSTNILRQQPRRALALTDIIMATLTPCGIEPSQSHVESFAKQLMERQIHSSKDRPALQVWDGVDILRFIKEAQDVGAVDEALWCTFLAAHFGRLSVGSPAPGEIESAGHFLCAFGQRPTWTWTYVSAQGNAFLDQLSAHEADLSTLRFGNHRKYCSSQPHALAKVVTSFVQWVACQGGSPSAAFAPQQGSTPEQGFHELYHRFDVYDFGRLGRFDLLSLLGEIGLLNIQPDSCYLVRSTGPLAGARKLCGASDDRFSAWELTKIIDNLACHLGISYSVMEDTLCLWQKKQPTTSDCSNKIDSVVCS